MALQTPMRVILSIGIILLLTGLLSACQTATAPAPTATPTPSPWIDVILNDPDCAPPCWNGITPGVTTMDEAWAIMQAEPGLRDLQLNDDLWNSIDWKFKNPSGSGYVRADFNDSTIVGTIIFSNDSYPTFTLGQAIEYLGEPDAVYYCRRPGFLWDVIAYFPQKGVIMPLDSNLAWLRLVNITPKYKVGSPIYFEPSFYLSEDTYFLDWEGYGTYKFEKGWIGE